MIGEIILLLITIVVVLFIKANRRPGKYAPGPLTFPILGHLPYFALNPALGPHKILLEWKKKYGPIITADFGSFPGIVIQDYKLIREAGNLPELSGRPKLPLFAKRCGNDNVLRGIIFNEGKYWSEQRGFIIRTLKEFGLGKSSTEDLILSETEGLIQRFVKNAGTPISTESIFTSAMLNSIWQIAAGETFEPNDPQLLALANSVGRNARDTSVGGIQYFMPWLADLAPKLTGLEDYLVELGILTDHMTKFVNRKILGHVPGQALDLSDAYVEVMNNETDPTSSFFKDEGKNNLVTTLSDLFSGSVETTSTTLRWFFLYLALHPEVQDKCRKEILENCHKDHLPTLADRKNLPYLEATILETLRLSSIAPFGLVHAAMKDVYFHGIFIPKGTMVFPGLYAANHDPAIWDEPQKFYPDRFLAPDSETLIKHEAFLAFSCGKRVCPGETLAKDQLFIVAASILQKFKVQTDQNNPISSMEPKSGGFILGPQSHFLIFNLA